MPQGAVSNVDENHIRASLTDDDLGGTLAIQSFILYKRWNRIVRVRDHDPFGFAKMRRHPALGAILRHHHSNSAH
jgi:hypothetical protein